MREGGKDAVRLPKILVLTLARPTGARGASAAAGGLSQERERALEAPPPYVAVDSAPSDASVQSSGQRVVSTVGRERLRQEPLYTVSTLLYGEKGY